MTVGTQDKFDSAFGLYSPASKTNVATAVIQHMQDCDREDTTQLVIRALAHKLTQAELTLLLCAITE